MKRIFALAMAVILIAGAPVATVSAKSLEELVGGQQATEQVQPEVQQQVVTPSQQPAHEVGQSGSTIDANNQQYINELRGATDMVKPDAGANKVTEVIGKAASFVIQIVAYFTTVMMTVRVVLDICYITVPFTRSILANGYAGVPDMEGAAGGPNGMGMNGMGMNGMGMNGMGMGMGGMSGMGMGMGGYGGRYGGGYGGMRGMGAQAANGMMNPGASNPVRGRVQWVSTQALNAVASEATMDANGGRKNAFKVYAKDMIVLLVATPIMLTLSITGVLANLGFLIGDMLARGIASVSQSI